MLADFGFQSVADFQRCCNIGSALVVDNVFGPKTKAAADHLPQISPHFRMDKDHLRSKGNGQCKVHRELLVALEELRRLWGHPLTILDMYRDPVYNAQVGGVGNSQHLYGLASDIPMSLHIPSRTVQAWKLFSGIGRDRVSGYVQHVDVRHVDPKTNSTRSTVAAPALWTYN